MATQANTFESYETGAGWRDAGPGRGARQGAAACRLPLLPNQGIYFYRKRIDNSRVSRQSDPKQRARDWRWIAATTACTFFLTALLWPSVYGLLAGYQIGTLQTHQQDLLAERATLELEQAYQLDPQKLDEIAAAQDLGDPAPDQVVYLPPAPDGSLAMNAKSQ